MFLKPSLVQEKVSEGQLLAGGAFNEIKLPNYINLKTKKRKKKKLELSNSEITHIIKLLSYVTWVFYFQFLF